MSDNKNGAEDELLMLLLIGGVIVGFGFLVWHLFKPQITEGIRWVRVAELSMSEYIAPEGYAVKYATAREPVTLTGMKTFLETAPVERITPTHIAVSSDLALRKLRTPIGILLILMGAYIFIWGPHNKFKKVHTLETLMKVQAKAFPYIQPVVDFDPSKVPNRAPGDPVPVKLPLFAEALSPEEWVAFNRLPMPEGKIDEAATAEALAAQLGARWQGWQKLPAGSQVLLAAFAMRAARKRSDSDTLLGRISLCWKPDGGLSLARDPKLLGVARAFLRSKAAEPTLKIMRQHAYVATAMVRALDHARSQGGVLSPGQFIWLRGHDRALWYPLNNLGRQAFHPEALGVMAHYKLEKLTQRPVPVPKMDSAVAALKGYFASSFARPIPPLDYGKGDVRAATSGKGRKAGIMKPAA